MKVLKGMQKLGEMKGTEVKIDWDYLLEGHGIRKEINDIQKLIGNLLRIISVAGILALFAYDLTLGNILLVEVLDVNRISDLLFWSLFGFIIYSYYLLRDRTKFVDTLDLKNLNHLRLLDGESRLPKEIELADYFDFDLLNIFDDLIDKSDKDFINNLLARLIKLPEVNKLIVRLGVDIETFNKINQKIYTSINTSRDKWIETIVFESFVIAYKNRFPSIDERVMFLTLCLHPLKETLLEFEILPTEVRGLLLWAKNEALKRHYVKLWRERASLKPKNSVNRSFTSVRATTLEKYKRDFTLEVLSGDFTMSIAREEELNEVVRLLHQGEKGAVLMVGSNGVGKTTLIKSLALRMVVEDVPSQLSDMRLIGFNFSRAYASAPSVDRFRGILEKIFEEVERAGNVVLVLDDFDQIVDVRQEVATEIVSLIVKAMDEYKLRVLATSTNTGYLENIKPNRSLVAAFDIVDIDEPEDDVAAQILIDMVPRLEYKYKLRIAFDSIRKAVELSHKYAFDRVLPEKAIDLLEEAAVFVEEQGLRFVSEKHIEELVSRKVGVNVGALSSDEKTKLNNLEEIMHERVIGQDAAIEAIAKALRRSRAGLVKENRPVASFLFFGPTGVGKTEVSKTLAESYYGNENQMIRIDMSEYQEDSNIGRLIGYRQGDDFFGGYLTTAVREKPFSIVLLDELEKANPKVLDLFLQVLDEGHLTDGIGRDVNFTNTIIIATSNVGSKKLSELIEKGLGYEEVYAEVTPELRKGFRVEFLNRFDKVIMFKPLTRAEIQQIAGLVMNSVSKKLYEKGIRIRWEDKLLEQLAKKGYNPVYGARELRRVVQEEVEDRLATLMVGGDVKYGDEVVFASLEDVKVIDN